MEGKVTIPLKYDGGNSLFFTPPIFNYELAPVSYKDKYGYINKFGEVIVPFKYDRAWTFKKQINEGEPRAKVELNFRMGSIDLKGKVRWLKKNF